MAFNSSLRMQQSQDQGWSAGYWRLAPERAFTVRPEEAGVLRVAHGRLWATLHGPHTGPANDWGDVVLRSGQEIALLPGQQLVVEPLGDAVNEPAFFSWEPRQPSARAASPADWSAWCDPLARPQLDSVGPLGLLLPIIAGLVRGLAAFVPLLVAGRGRVLSQFESNQP